MAKKKPAAPKKMTLKKKVVPKASPVHQYKVRFGTRNELGPERQFPTETAAKNAIIAEFNSWIPWTERYNRVGIDIIKASADQVGSIVFHRDPSRLECCFDDHSGMHVTAEYWTIR